MIKTYSAAISVAISSENEKTAMITAKRIVFLPDISAFFQNYIPCEAIDTPYPKNKHKIILLQTR
jgi:hypothetical protein